jgi:hypothetical protein
MYDRGVGVGSIPQNRDLFQIGRRAAASQIIRQSSLSPRANAKRYTRIQSRVSAFRNQ